VASVNPSVRVVKQFTFKGGVRQWSNRYHFAGGVPPDATHWDTLFDAIVLKEKAALLGNNTIVECLGYVAGSDVAVASKNYTTVGTLAAGGSDHGCPGENVALTRYSTGARSTKNHPIYCFSYYHGTYYDGSVGPDKLSAGQKAALETYAGFWLTGFSDGGSVTATRSSPAGHDCTGHLTEEWITHRDFPYTTSV
jgi:hypothetical protein